MNSYKIVIEFKVYLLANGYQYKKIEFLEKAKNKEQALFNVMKRINSESVKLSVQATNTKKVIGYELNELISVKLIPQHEVYKLVKGEKNE